MKIYLLDNFIRRLLGFFTKMTMSSENRQWNFSSLCKWKCLWSSHVQLCNPKDCGPPGSSVHGILQTGILEWVAFLSLGDLSDPGIEPGSSVLQVDSLLSEPPGKTLLKSIQLHFFYCLLVTQGPEILC